jgi:hypothetical protein
MAIFDLFSKRQKRLRGDVRDVYSYDEVPQPLRVQIVHIWRDSLGSEKEYYDEYIGVQRAYKFIVETLCREYGVFRLTGKNYGERNFMEELINFFLQEEDAEKVIDVIEISFRFINGLNKTFNYRGQSKASEIADNAIEELNIRLKEHGIGYQFEGGDIIRVDSQLLHREAVRPALILLNAKEYAGAQQEFLKTFEHYKHSKYKEALNEALRSFESTLKTICDKRGWGYDPKDTSKRLVEICYQNGLIPTFWQQNMSALRGLLEGGVSTGRHKLSAHGQGSKPIVVPDYIVSYVLHMAAAIVFLVKAEQALK